ncbi:MAG: hypothetical protein PHD74_05650 [Candidatus Krumholzibacteria bacterium]|nr:hypothetical protein [Candidatus Krumholzibacteria bacterium]
MRPKLRREIILVFACAAVLFTAGTLKSREDYMTSLPVYKHFKCLLCHASARPTSSSDLNVFGAAYRANGHSWDAAIAIADSDGDGYANGIELGDENGDGTAEIGFERSNPGDRSNTPNSVDLGTWGLLKSLFED